MPPWARTGRSGPRPGRFDLTSCAAPAVERFRLLTDRRRDTITTVADEQFDAIGFSPYPYGSDP